MPCDWANMIWTGSPGTIWISIETATVVTKTREQVADIEKQLAQLEEQRERVAQFA